MYEKTTYIFIGNDDLAIIIAFIEKKLQYYLNAKFIILSKCLKKKKNKKFVNLLMLYLFATLL